MTIDQQRLDEFLAGFAGDQAAAMHMSTVVLGEQLGLYRALADGGPQTAPQLADRTGYEPLLVAEHLGAQAPDREFAAVAAEAGFSHCRRVSETPLHRVLAITP